MIVSCMSICAFICTSRLCTALRRYRLCRTALYKLYLFILLPSLIATFSIQLAMKTVDLRKIPEDYRERATDEAKLLHTLNHRHLVHHVNSYIKHPYLCIITEFCSGGDMDKLIGRLGFDGGLPEKLIVCWLMQAASALNVRDLFMLLLFVCLFLFVLLFVWLGQIWR